MATDASRTALFLKDLGIGVTEERFLSLVRAAFSAAAGESSVANRWLELPSGEEAVLDSGHFLEKRPVTEQQSPMFQGALSYAAIVASALDTTRAAKLLGVDPSRIRQRLTEKRPTLYGIKSRGEWVLPRFQFHGKRQVSGIVEVIQALPTDLSPVSVVSWFNTQNPDLVTGPDEDQTLSPLDWLKSGNDPQPVIELAEQL